MEANAYWAQYDLLWRNAKSWGIDHTRYTHQQLRQAIELNKGVVDGTLRARLIAMPPVNAYHAATNFDRADKHTPPQKPAIKKAEPVIEPFSSPKKAVPGPSFSIPAPKESFPWNSSTF